MIATILLRLSAFAAHIAAIYEANWGDGYQDAYVCLLLALVFLWASTLTPQRPTA